MISVLGKVSTKNFGNSRCFWAWEIQDLTSAPRFTCGSQDRGLSAFALRFTADRKCAGIGHRLAGGSAEIFSPPTRSRRNCMPTA